MEVATFLYVCHGKGREIDCTPLKQVAKELDRDGLYGQPVLGEEKASHHQKQSMSSRPSSI